MATSGTIFAAESVPTVETRNPHSQALRAGDSRLASGDGLERDTLLTVSAAAVFLGNNPATVVRWIDGGRLHGWSTPGGHRRTNCESVVALLEKEGRPLPASLHHLRQVSSTTRAGARMCFDGPNLVVSTDPALKEGQALNDASELTPPAIAVALGVSSTSVVRWMNEGLILTSDVEGKHRRASVEAVRHFLEAHNMPVPLLFRPAS